MRIFAKTVRSSKVILFLPGDNDFNLSRFANHALEILSFLKTARAEENSIALYQVIFSASITQKSDVITTNLTVFRTNKFNLFFLIFYTHIS